MNTSLQDTLSTAQPGERLTGLDNEKKPIDGLFQSFDTTTGILTLKAIGGDDLQNHNIENISSLSKLTLGKKAQTVNTNTSSLSLQKNPNRGI